jgi:hypothetical protein
LKYRRGAYEMQEGEVEIAGAFGDKRFLMRVEAPMA